MLFPQKKHILHNRTILDPNWSQAFFLPSLSFTSELCLFGIVWDLCFCFVLWDDDAAVSGELRHETQMVAIIGPLENIFFNDPREESLVLQQDIDGKIQTYRIVSSEVPHLAVMLFKGGLEPQPVLDPDNLNQWTFTKK